MMLDRIDIDAHGPLQRVELGPFAEHLNVVVGPPRSGKTAIARFIRDSLVERQYPLGMMSSSSGRVVWADMNGMVHCRREQDGTPHGRTTVEFQPRGDDAYAYRQHRHSWISDIGDSSPSSRAVRSLRLPESLVDGVVTDTSVTHVGRVVAACVAAGLDSPETYRRLPRGYESAWHERGRFEPLDAEHQSRLRRQLAEVEAELGRLHLAGFDYQTLVQRRDELSSRLADATRRSNPYDVEWDRDAAQRRLTELNDRARRLRTQQSELREATRTGAWSDRYRWSAYERGSVVPGVYDRTHPSLMDDSLRRDLDDIDAQVIGWRRTLFEVRGLREALRRDEAVRRHYDDPHGFAASRRRQLNGLLHDVGRYEPDRLRHWYGRAPQNRLTTRWEEVRDRVRSATQQIDWLLNRYSHSDRGRAWYDSLSPATNYRTSSALDDALRAIREDLLHVATHAESADVDRWSRNRQVEELTECQNWLVAAIDQLMRHRESLLRAHPVVGQERFDRRYDWDRDAWEQELRRVSAELDDCLTEAADLRKLLQAEDRPERRTSEWTDPQAIHHEIQRIDEQLAGHSRVRWLSSQRSDLLRKLEAGSTVRHDSPLAHAASRWLVRLSAGRLRSIVWPYARYRNAPSSGPASVDGLKIDGRPEEECTATDRAVAAIAVRMAAADLLAMQGRPVPLVLETPQGLFSGYTPTDSREPVGPNAVRESMLTAFADYARDGRQLVVLTGDEELGHRIGQTGGRLFQLLRNPVVHGHRPIWRPHYQGERYVGPHPHTYGDVAAPPPRQISDINRDFDMAWREVYGLYDTPEQPSTRPVRTDWAAPGEPYRDGYYAAETYTTVTPSDPRRFDENGCWVSGELRSELPTGARGQESDRSSLRETVAESPFFLTVDSPIDQAPSIDAVAAARLRGLSVTHVNHLMQQDSNRLADALGLSSVSASTVRRWQAECRLMCRVPKLRGFDARVLVGCGVTDPAQLAAIHPVDLLQEVEAFLATERGQQILLSGTSHELSRITSWIAAANSSPEERAAAQARAEKQTYLNSSRDRESGYAFDSDRYEYDRGNSANYVRDRNGVRRRRSTLIQSDASARDVSSPRRSKSDRYRSGDDETEFGTSRTSSKRTRRRSTSASGSRGTVDLESASAEHFRIFGIATLTLSSQVDRLSSATESQRPHPPLRARARRAGGGHRAGRTRAPILLAPGKSGGRRAFDRATHGRTA